MFVQAVDEFFVGESGQAEQQQAQQRETFHEVLARVKRPAFYHAGFMTPAISRAVIPSLNSVKYWTIVDNVVFVFDEIGGYG
ncbi:hypothetical protein PS3A_24280 [Pseudomonas sp. 3A(2025)]